MDMAILDLAYCVWSNSEISVKMNKNRPEDPVLFASPLEVRAGPALDGCSCLDPVRRRWVHDPSLLAPLEVGRCLDGYQMAEDAYSMPVVLPARKCNGPAVSKMQQAVEWLCPSGFLSPEGMLGQRQCRARQRVSGGEKKEGDSGTSADHRQQFQRPTKAKDAPSPLQPPPWHVRRDQTISYLY